MSALEINAMYGTITRDIFDIHDVDLLHQLQQFVAALRQSEKKIESSVLTKQEVLDEFKEACHEYKQHQTTGAELLDFDSVLKAIA